MCKFDRGLDTFAGQRGTGPIKDNAPRIWKSDMDIVILGLNSKYVLYVITETFIKQHEFLKHTTL